MKRHLPIQRQARTEWYDRYSKWSDYPLLVLSVLMLGTLLLPDAFALTPQESDILDLVDWVIYAVFALDLGIKLYLAPSVKEHVKTHWLDVVIVALPLLRPLRIIQSARFLRLVRLIRVVTFATYRRIHLFHILSYFQIQLANDKLTSQDANPLS